LKKYWLFIFLFFCVDITHLYSAAVLIFPTENAKLSRDNFNFIWHSYNQNTKFILEIAKDKQFNNIVYKKESKLFDISIEDQNNFDAGLYYWRIAEIFEDNPDKIEYSEIISFEIADNVKTSSEIVINTAADTSANGASDTLQSSSSEIKSFEKKDTMMVMQTDLMAEIAKMTEEIAILQKKLDEKEADQSKLNKQLINLENSLIIAKDENVKLLEKLNNRDKELAIERQNIKKLEEQLTAKNEELKKQSAAIIPVNNLYNEAVATIKMRETELTNLKLERNEYIKKLVLAETKTKEQEQKNKELQEMTLKLQQELAKVKQDYAKVLSASGELIAENDKLKKNFAGYASNILKDRLLEINQSFDSQRYSNDREYRNYILKTLENYEKINEIFQDRDYNFSLVVLYFKIENYNKALNLLNRLQNLNEQELRMKIIIENRLKISK